MEGGNPPPRSDQEQAIMASLPPELNYAEVSSMGIPARRKVAYFNALNQQTYGPSNNSTQITVTSENLLDLENAYLQFRIKNLSSKPAVFDAGAHGLIHRMEIRNRTGDSILTVDEYNLKAAFEIKFQSSKEDLHDLSQMEGTCAYIQDTLVAPTALDLANAPVEDLAIDIVQSAPGTIQNKVALAKKYVGGSGYRPKRQLEISNGVTQEVAIRPKCAWFRTNLGHLLPGHGKFVLHIQWAPALEAMVYKELAQPYHVLACTTANKLVLAEKASDFMVVGQDVRLYHGGTTSLTTNTVDGKIYRIKSIAAVAGASTQFLNSGHFEVELTETSDNTAKTFSTGLVVDATKPMTLVPSGEAVTAGSYSSGWSRTIATTDYEVSMVRLLIPDVRVENAEFRANVEMMRNKGHAWTSHTLKHQNFEVSNTLGEQAVILDVPSSSLNHWAHIVRRQSSILSACDYGLSRSMIPCDKFRMQIGTEYYPDNDIEPIIATAGIYPGEAVFTPTRDNLRTTQLLEEAKNCFGGTLGLLTDENFVQNPDNDGGGGMMINLSSFQRNKHLFSGINTKGIANASRLNMNKIQSMPGAHNASTVFGSGESGQIHSLADVAVVFRMMPDGNFKSAY